MSVAAFGSPIEKCSLEQGSGTYPHGTMCNALDSDPVSKASLADPQARPHLAKQVAPETWRVCPTQYVSPLPWYLSVSQTKTVFEDAMGNNPLPGTDTRVRFASPLLLDLPVSQRMIRLPDLALPSAHTGLEFDRPLLRLESYSRKDEDSQPLDEALDPMTVSYGMRFCTDDYHCPDRSFKVILPINRATRIIMKDARFALSQARIWLYEGELCRHSRHARTLSIHTLC